SMSSETCESPASSSSAMKGVVFQISAIMIANIAGQCDPNQFVSGLMPGTQENQSFTKPLLMLNANCQVNAETTVTMPYGIRMDVRITPRAKRIRCITIAKMKPITNSTATVTTMITTVFQVSFQNSESVRIVP